MENAGRPNRPDRGAHGGLYQPVGIAQRLHEGIVQQITHQIVSGAILPGTPLPIEPELAQQFGVSRTVIREACRLLSAKGLVVARHGSGTWVQSADHWDHLDPLILFESIQTHRDDTLLDEILEMRRVIEVEVAACAAARRTADDIEHLRASLNAMQSGILDPDEYNYWDGQFHAHILNAARNRLLHQAMRPVSQALELSRQISARRQGALPQSLRGHEEIFAAIHAGEAGQAREAMRQHIVQFERDIRASLRQGTIANLPALTARDVGKG